MKWSNYQSDIFDFIQFDEGNAIIEAVAGSGKTTTIVEGMKRVPPKSSSIFLAFNKAIAMELKTRGVNARTFHSLGCSAAMRYKNASSINNDKLDLLLNAHFSDNEVFLYGSFVKRLVGIGKQIGLGCLVPDSQSNWYQIIDHHDLELEKAEASVPRAIEIATDLLAKSNSSNMIDFDDMLYTPVLEGLTLPKFDYIFVDEAQDTNAIQRALLRKIMKLNSRLIAVGDPAQAIYGFRGADSNSLILIRKEFKCHTLPLSVSYRCASEIVNFAHQWVSHIQAASEAPKGEVLDLGTDWNVSQFGAQDLVVCRTTRPLISLGLKMLKERIPVTILGREIGKNLVTLIRKFKTNDLKELDAKVELWSIRQIERAVVKMDEGKIAAIEDRVACIRMLSDQLKDEDSDVDGLIRIVEELFAPSQCSTTLATIHKSKGLEADTVYWLNSSQCPSRWARQDWQKTQEANLCYVATTRARTKLIRIEE